mgnify:CR=1 FL=1
MIRVSEMVLPGHPDKFCDQVADAIVQACYAVDKEAYCQVEMSCWSDEIFLTGGIVTARPLQKSLEDIVRETGHAIGYVQGNAIDVARYRIRNSVCLDTGRAAQWTRHVNDQCISIGWADNPVWNRAQHYLQRADAERRRVQVRIDLDGDGQFDATRRPNILQLTRI